MPVSKPDCPYALQRKAREIPPRCRAVLSPQSGLLRKNREKWASFAYFEGKAGGISLQLRIAGGESGIFRCALFKGLLGVADSSTFGLSTRLQKSLLRTVAVTIGQDRSLLEAMSIICFQKNHSLAQRRRKFKDRQLNTTRWNCNHRADHRTKSPRRQ